MNNKLTIIMYHYVRNLANSKYPNIKGLDIVSFKNQIDYLKKNYNIINTEYLFNMVNRDFELPPKSVLLTFDDGFIDHYKYVFPIFRKEKIQGFFFPPAKPILENIILNVHKIQFILASVSNEKKLLKVLFNLLDKHRRDFNLKSNDEYYNLYARSSRFDIKEVIFFKRMLQVVLPEELQGIICGEIFKKFVTEDIASFSNELYMQPDQLTEMINSGMHIGSHGYEHYWLSSLNKDLQRTDINKSIKFLDSIGQDLNELSICYPYGDYNKDTFSIITNLNFKIGFTTEVDIANLSKHDKLTLPRLDTNDIPKDKNSITNIWYTKA